MRSPAFSWASQGAVIEQPRTCGLHKEVAAASVDALADFQGDSLIPLMLRNSSQSHSMGSSLLLPTLFKIKAGTPITFLLLRTQSNRLTLCSWVW